MPRHKPLSGAATQRASIKSRTADFPCLYNQIPIPPPAVHPGRSFCCSKAFITMLLKRCGFLEMLIVGAVAPGLGCRWVRLAPDMERIEQPQAGFFQSPREGAWPCARGRARSPRPSRTASQSPQRVQKRSAIGVKVLLPGGVGFHTNVSRKCDFRRFYGRAGVSPAIERLTHAGETPALHSEVQKQATFGITLPGTPALHPRAINTP